MDDRVATYGPALQHGIRRHQELAVPATFDHQPALDLTNIDVLFVGLHDLHSNPLGRAYPQVASNGREHQLGRSTGLECRTTHVYLLNSPGAAAWPARRKSRPRPARPGCGGAACR